MGWSRHSIFNKYLESAWTDMPVHHFDACTNQILDGWSNLNNTVSWMTRRWLLTNQILLVIWWSDFLHYTMMRKVISSVRTIILYIGHMTDNIVFLHSINIFQPRWWTGIRNESQLIVKYSLTVDSRWLMCEWMRSER